MKIFVFAVMLFSVCTFSSCNKTSTNSSGITGNGSVIFWTNNATKLTACSSSIQITITEILTGKLVGHAKVTGLNSSAPTTCGGGLASLSGLTPGTSYLATTDACFAGGFGSSFSVSPNECLPIELP